MAGRDRKAANAAAASTNPLMAPAPQLGTENEFTTNRINGMASKRRSKAKPKETPAPQLQANRNKALAEFHLSIGWWLLLVFVVLGVVLESLHGFKVAWYLDVGQESRRLLWRLAHAHGTFLALVHIGFAATLWIRGREPSHQRMLASRSLLAASLLVPAGFFLGGTSFYAGDPGVGIILLPIGAVVLIVAVVLTATAKR